MNIAKHTPTPWTFRKMPTLNNPYWIVGNNKEDVVSFRNTYQSCTDAQFIIKAVNNHDRLIEALKNVLNVFNDVSGDHYRACGEAKQLLTDLKQQ